MRVPVALASPMGQTISQASSMMLGMIGQREKPLSPVRRTRIHSFSKQREKVRASMARAPRRRHAPMVSLNFLYFLIQRTERTLPAMEKAVEATARRLTSLGRNPKGLSQLSMLTKKELRPPMVTIWMMKSFTQSRFLKSMGMPLKKGSLGWELEQEGGVGGCPRKKARFSTKMPPMNTSWTTIRRRKDSFPWSWSQMSTGMKVPSAPEIIDANVSRVVTATRQRQQDEQVRSWGTTSWQPPWWECSERTRCPLSSTPAPGARSRSSCCKAALSPAPLSPARTPPRPQIYAPSSLTPIFSPQLSTIPFATRVNNGWLTMKISALIFTTVDEISQVSDNSSTIGVHDCTIIEPVSAEPKKINVTTHLYPYCLYSTASGFDSAEVRFVADSFTFSILFIQIVNRMFDENNTIPCLKLILLGTLNVGKTNIALKYVKDEFIDKVKSTIGNELSKKTTIKDGRLVTLVIWDTSGDVIKYNSIQKIYFQGVHIALLIYDIADRATFGKLDLWLNELRTHNDFEKCQVMLIGNKVDLEEQRQVSYKEGLKYAEKNELLFMETSAKTGQNVNAAFDKILEEFVKATNLEIRSSNGSRIRRPRNRAVEKTEGSGYCC